LNEPGFGANLRSFFFRFVATISLLVQPVIAMADDLATCRDELTDVGIAACTRAIESGKFEGTKLMTLYAKRGYSLTQKENPDLDRAIADYTQAIRIEPDAFIYLSRGIAYAHKGDRELAKSDLNTVLAFPDHDNFHDAAREVLARFADATIIKLECEAISLGNFIVVIDTENKMVRLERDADTTAFKDGAPASPLTRQILGGGDQYVNIGADVISWGVRGMTDKGELVIRSGSLDRRTGGVVLQNRYHGECVPLGRNKF
jgi:hypothetical protein